MTVRASLAACGTLILGLGLGSPVAGAQDRELNVERFTPAVDRHGFLGFQGTYAPGPGRWNIGYVLDYSKSPLVVNDGSGDVDVVRHRFGSNLYGQIGIGGRFGIAIDLPLVLYQTGNVDLLRDGGPPLARGSWGDPRLILRYRIVGQDSRVERERPEGPGIALVGAVTAPIGDQDSFANEANATMDLGVAADFHVLGAGAGLTLGWRHRFDTVDLGTVTFRDELMWGVGLKLPIPVTQGLLGQIAVRGSFDAGFSGASAQRVVEGDLGISYTTGDITVGGVVGTGFTDAVGTPTIRGMATVDWAPRVRDSDDDGIPDDRDECRHLPEDFDGFEDSDGCMDPDNDADTIPDAEDRCPDEPAEEGRDADEDGCTDEQGDADSDGVPDDVDSCPRDAEDMDGHQDDDGCPDPDNDGDGVPDADDGCPHDAEDRDGFQDDDGCPEPDNDGDGVPDADDQCPTEAEDTDGFEDLDGCPEPDNDMDSVPDEEDECPEEPETINGRDDGDGCPDTGGRSLWSIEAADDGPTRMSGRVAFSRDGSVSRASVGSLDQLARHLFSQWRRRWQIGVGTQDAAQVESLRRGLIERNVPADRFQIVLDTGLRAPRVVVTRGE